jgi:hypothetical protein
MNVFTAEGPYELIVLNPQCVEQGGEGRCLFTADVKLTLN